LRLEIEKSFRERSEEGGGCAYVSLREYAGRFKVSDAEVLRDIASLVEAGEINVSVVEVNS
jgi:hypothetical protein